MKGTRWGRTAGRDQDVLRFIRHTIRTTGVAPSRMMIARQIGSENQRAADHAIARLVADGHIEVMPGVHRGIKIRSATIVTKTEDL